MSDRGGGGAEALYDGDKLLMSKTAVILMALGCLATLLLALLDINIVTAVSWKMVADLDPVHGVSLLPWLTTSYALADCVVVPLYGKLSDVYGPKPVFVFSLTTFLIGSGLCGIARDMTQLILYRTVQGVGAGGLTAVALIIMGTLFRDDDEDEAGGATSTKVAFASVMVGVGLALGPTLGGFVADSLDWRWVFYLNLPLGLAILLVAITKLRLPRHRERRKVDFLGAALIAGAAAALLLVADWGGKKYPWNSGTITLLGISGLILLGAFVWRVLTAPDPLVPLRLLRHPVLRVMMPVSLFTGMGIAGGLFYIGGYLQVGRGLSATQAGLLTLCMAVGLVASVFVAKWILAAFGKFKYLLFAAGLLQAIVLACFGMLTSDTSFWLVGLGEFMIGIAIGQSLGIAMQFTQNSVGLEDIGVATTSLRFNQQLGVALGFAIFSTVMTRTLANNLTGAAGAANNNGELNTSILETLPPDQRQAAVSTFIGAIDIVFLMASAIALITGVIALFLKEKAPWTDVHGASRTTG
ncbi:MFS transporter [Amycolatopsis sp. NPDC102389]|uniref:MFS transporter n=1 Tax=Amycolatopsis sp. NPDC102389 TaxID=3363941 RepID=UPI00382C86DD